MSRSYRQPYWTAGYGSKIRKKAKRAASKAVRRFKDKINGGMSYKKLFCSWDIRDWTFFDAESGKARRK